MSVFENGKIAFLFVHFWAEKEFGECHHANILWKNDGDNFRKSKSFENSRTSMEKKSNDG